MFSIKVENANKDWWSVYPAKEYRVRHFAESQAVVITTINDSEDGQKTKDITVEQGQVAYVMNGSGQTVDTIRARRKAHAS